MVFKLLTTTGDIMPLVPPQCLQPNGIYKSMHFSLTYMHAASLEIGNAEVSTHAYLIMMKFHGSSMIFSFSLRFLIPLLLIAYTFLCALTESCSQMLENILHSISDQPCI